MAPIVKPAIGLARPAEGVRRAHSRGSIRRRDDLSGR